MQHKVVQLLIIALVGFGGAFLHQGVVDELSYDPSLLSLLQMEQSLGLEGALDLDQHEDDYFGLNLIQDDFDFNRPKGAQVPSLLQLEQEVPVRTHSGSLLQLQGPDSQRRTVAGSLIQLHNAEAPATFLQNDAALLSEEREAEEEEGAEPVEADVGPATGRNLKSYVLKSESGEDLTGGLEDELVLVAGENTAFDELVAIAAGYKVWLVLVTVLLLAVLVVRLFYLDRFLKFKAELWARMDQYNKVLLDKFNTLFKRGQSGAKGEAEGEDEDRATEDTPLLTA